MTQNIPFLTVLDIFMDWSLRRISQSHFEITRYYRCDLPIYETFIFTTNGHINQLALYSLCYILSDFFAPNIISLSSISEIYSPNQERYKAVKGELSKHKVQWARLRDFLIEYKTLTGEECRTIFKGGRPSRLPSEGLPSSWRNLTFTRSGGRSRKWSVCEGAIREHCLIYCLGECFIAIWDVFTATCSK